MVPVWAGGSGQTAQRVGCGTALQRDAECAHAHHQGRGDRAGCRRSGFGVDEFRDVIAGRLDKLVPLCYQLIDVPLKFHHPMWRETATSIAPTTSGPSGWPPRAVAASSTRRSGGSPALRWIVAARCGRCIRRGSGQQPHRGGRQDPPRARRRRRLGEPDGPRHRSDPDPAGRVLLTDPAPSNRGLVTSAFADHMRHIARIPRDRPVHRAGVGAGATQLAQAVTGTDPAVRAAADVHESQAHAGAHVRHRHARVRRRQGDRQDASGRRSTTWSSPCRPGRSGPCCCATTARPIRCWRRFR